MNDKRPVQKNPTGGKRAMSPYFRRFVLVASFCVAAQSRSMEQGERRDIVGMIAQAREAVFRSGEEVKGVIRTGDRSVAFRSALSSHSVEVFIPEQSRRFRIPLQGDYHLEEFIEDRWQRLTALATELIPGTVLSFEDLSFRFLFWPNVRELGITYLHGKPCTLVRFIPAPGESQYGYVDLAIEQTSSTPLRAVCHSTDGNEVKRWEPIRVARLGEGWAIKVIRVMMNSSNRWDPTYIELETAAKP